MELISDEDEKNAALPRLLMDKKVDGIVDVQEFTPQAFKLGTSEPIVIYCGAYTYLTDVNNRLMVLSSVQLELANVLYMLKPAYVTDVSKTKNLTFVDYLTEQIDWNEDKIHIDCDQQGTTAEIGTCIKLSLYITPELLYEWFMNDTKLSINVNGGGY